MKPFVLVMLAIALSILNIGCGDTTTTQSAPISANVQPASSDAINVRNQLRSEHKQLVRGISPR